MSVEAYVQALAVRGLSPRTVRNRRIVLTAFEREVGFAGVTAAQALAWIAAHTRKPDANRVYRHTLNHYMAWRGTPLQLPSLKVGRHLLAPSDLVTPAEVARLVAAAEHPRDRALIAVLYETGARARELLGLRRKDIEFGETLSRVRLSGKTGDRIVPIMDSVPHLQAWLTYCRPLAPEEPVWQTAHGRMSYNRLGVLLATLSLRVLGRRIPCHRLRHSRASHLAAHPAFNEALIALFGGWRVGSKTLATYIHLGGRDLDSALLAVHGKTRPAPTVEASPLEPKPCPRCQKVNPADARFCSQCSLTLDAAEAQRILQRDQEVDAFLAWLVAHPEEVRRLKQAMQHDHQ